MSHCRRKQILTDEAVQGELLFRTIIYWFCCLSILSLLTLAWSWLTGPTQPFTLLVRQCLVNNAPLIFGAVILLPVVLVDVLKVSNRFVGPVQQVKYVMAQLASGTSARRVYLRNDDFWQELADYTNRVADELETLREDQESDVDEIDADEIDADEIDAEHPFPEVELTPSDEPTAAEVC